jgi:DNA-binding beta-propeller fold protein YncE
MLADQEVLLTKIRMDIPVGKAPTAIGFNYFTNTIYVANEFDNTVSVIDSEANKVVAGAMFDIKPLDTGYIECDKLIAPMTQQI